MADSDLLREARELYDRFRAVHAENDSDGGSGALAKLNHAVRSEVGAAIRGPLEDALDKARTGAESAREVARELGELPGMAQTELRGLPASAGLEGVDEVPTALRSVARTLTEVANEPSKFYPRLLCGSIPVDPAKVMRALSKANVGALAGGAPGAGGDESTPKSTAEFAAVVAKSFGGVSDPIVDGIHGLKGARDMITSVTETLSELSGGDDGDLGGLAGAQEKVSEIVYRFTGLFSDDDVESEVAERGLSRPDCVDSVDQGAQLARDAGDMAEPLTRGVDIARSLGEKVASIGGMIREVFEKFVQLLKTLVEHVKAFIAKLPALLEQIRAFFVPSGLWSLVMAPSPEIEKLLKSVDALRSGVPQPDALVAARGKLQDSAGARAADSIAERIQALLETPLELARKLAELASELPHKIIAAAKDAIERWVKEHGVDVVGDKIEDGLQDVAHKIGGEKLADFVGDVLPFGSDDENDPEAQRKKDRILGAANNLLGSFF